MRIAFYAPLKSPNHDIPSGDREIARLLIRMLEKNGHDVEVVSDFRSYIREPNDLDNVRQRALQEIEILDRTTSNHIKYFDMWITYHVYYKSPDWLGTYFCEKYNMPYILVETSYAKKRSVGAWRNSNDYVISSIKLADKIICINPKDVPGLKELILQQGGDDRKVVNMMVPIHCENEDFYTEESRKTLANQYAIDTNKTWILTVAQMRHGSKSRSYDYALNSIAQLLDRNKEIGVENTNWHWLIVGAGDISQSLDKRLREHSCLYDHVTIVGAVTSEQVRHYYLASEIFFWPAYKEAIGIAMLEACSHGLAIVCGNHGAITSYLENGIHALMADPEDVEQHGENLKKLINNGAFRNDIGKRARHHVRKNHCYQQQASRLDSIILS